MDEVIEVKSWSWHFPSLQQKARSQKVISCLVKYGPTLGCNACEGLPVEHSEEFKDRFVSLLAENSMKFLKVVIASMTHGFWGARR